MMLSLKPHVLDELATATVNQSLRARMSPIVVRVVTTAAIDVMVVAELTVNAAAEAM